MKILYQDNHILVAAAEELSPAIAENYIRSVAQKEGAVFVRKLTSAGSGIGVFARTSKAEDRLKRKIKQECVSISDKGVKFSREGDWLFRAGFSHPTTKQRMEFTFTPEWREYKSELEKAADGYSVVYCDENIIVADKAARVLTAAADGGSSTLEHRLRERYGEVYAVHRLDYATSGLVIFARNSKARAALDEGMKLRTFDKIYECAVSRRPNLDSATLTAYAIKDSRAARVKVYASPKKGALTMKTAYRVISSNGARSLLEVRLITGRTHQIRAHMAFIGCPIIGDDKYGGAKQGDRLLLCARRLRLHFKGGILAYLDGREFTANRDWNLD